MDLNENTPENPVGVVKREQVYAFTWCPDTRYHGASYIDQFKDTYKILRKLRFCIGKNYRIYPELTVNGNIHYHGQFTIENQIYWFKSALPLLKRHGFVRVDKIKLKLKDNWQEYIKKESKSMISILDLSKEQFDEDGLSLHIKTENPKMIINVQPSITDIINSNKVDDNNYTIRIY